MNSYDQFDLDLSRSSIELCSDFFNIALQLQLGFNHPQN